MNKGQTIFAQLMSLIPEREFKECVEQYKGNYRIRNFTCRDQFLVMCYAPFTNRDSLRDWHKPMKLDAGRYIETSLKSF
jgi:hypothetical protein